MRFSTTVFVFIILILIFSIFVANFANIISTDNEVVKKMHENYSNNKWLKNQEKFRIDNKNEHLMWFVQVSDIHISIFENPDRIEQFEKFVNETLDIIEPKVVLASGDLTDAKDKDKLGSRQYVKEWQIYKDILQSSNILKKTVWLDIRGNHDYFNVPDINSELNFFSSYSVQGINHKRSYLYQLRVDNEKYSFIAVDACLEPGPKRPFNFIGLLDKNETSHLIDLVNESKRSGGNYTIWFGHYPTSCILSAGIGNNGIRGLIGMYDESYAYLCGHLHTQAGMVPHMYTFQKTGYLELELGDWKSSRLFRVAAFDHGLFSFVDVTYESWPIILITNPKHALFNIPRKENPYLQQTSTHIRMLVFTPAKVAYCSAQINEDQTIECQKISKNVYVVPWNPENYKYGIHSLKVLVRTSDGNSKMVNQPFSLDGSRMNFDVLARFILMVDACTVFQILFGAALALCILPMSILRVLHELVLSGKCNKPRIRNNFMKNTIRKLWTLSSIDQLFLPLIIYFIYISIGPWAIGEVIDGHIGVIFVWGIFVNNSFLPGSLTYLYGFLQLTFCQLPLIFIYANEVTKRLDEMNGIKGTSRIIRHFRHLPFITITTIEVILALFFWWAYGTLAFIIGPFRTWSVVLNIILWYYALNVTEQNLKPANIVFYSSDEANEDMNSHDR